MFPRRAIYQGKAQESSFNACEEGKGVLGLFESPDHFPADDPFVRHHAHRANVKTLLQAIHNRDEGFTRLGFIQSEDH